VHAYTLALLVDSSCEDMDSISTIIICRSFSLLMNTRRKTANKRND